MLEGGPSASLDKALPKEELRAICIVDIHRWACSVAALKTALLPVAHKTARCGLRCGKFIVGHEDSSRRVAIADGGRRGRNGSESPRNGTVVFHIYTGVAELNGPIIAARAARAEQPSHGVKSLHPRSVCGRIYR